MTLTTMVAALTLALSGAGSDESACSLSGPFPARREGLVVLAVATPARQWVTGATALSLGWPVDLEALPDLVWGQVFEVIEDNGRFPREGPPLVVVPWDYDSHCDLTAWSEASWVPPLDTVVFALSDERERTGVHHVLGAFEPYPISTRGLLLFGEMSTKPWLTAREYFEVMLNLPSKDRMTQDPKGAARTLRAWLERRGLVDRFPANEFLRRWEELGEGQ